jgi:CheY-like chemotaxis protein
VEDHPDTGTTLGRYLERNGLHVEVCRMVSEALALLQGGRFHYDFVLLDLLMPSEERPDDPAGGLAVLRQVRQGPIATTIVVVTGSDNPVHHERARQHGAAAILAKPVDLDELLALMGVVGESAA